MVLSNIIRKKLVNFLDKHKLLKYIICLICTVEAEVRFITDSKLCDFLDNCSSKVVNEDEDLLADNFPINDVIPSNTYYCEDCDMRSFSKLAQLIFGSGHYCLYLQRGDFSFSQPTDLLWDGVKCCGINQGIPSDIIYEDFEEC